MLRFHYDVLLKRSCGSSMGQGETASVERPSAAGHLQHTIGHCNERWGENGKRFILFISINTL